jgi:flagellar motor switch protein FliG
VAEEEQVEDTGYDVGKLEGVDKAAILLLSLTEDDAAQILKHLEPKQVQKLGTAMAQIDDMTQTKITNISLKTFKITVPLVSKAQIL